MAPSVNAQGKVTLVPSARKVVWKAGPPSFPKAVKYAVLYGDPAKEGPFAIRAMMPPHALFPLHTHSMNEILTVISGHFTHYVGQDKQHLQSKTMAAGGFLVLPKGTGHALQTNDSAAVVEVVGNGPFGMTYVDPSDDPSK